MTVYNMYEARTNLSKIARLLEDRIEDEVIISKYGKPVMKVTLYEDNKRANLFGCANNLFTVPDNFDDIDISDYFSTEIYPE